MPAGTYERSYDGFTFTNSNNPATVSALRLDRYEVTVGRFRQFVTYMEGVARCQRAVREAHAPKWRSWTQGQWRRLRDGLERSGVGRPGASTSGAWDSNLGGGTWTATSASNESLPITNVDWYEAYAFCIWDGGFLPSEAEWNYAASGGAEQRAYPWAPAYPPGSTAMSCANANYSDCPTGAPNAVGTESPGGDGRWGQSDWRVTLGSGLWIRIQRMPRLAWTVPT